LGARVYEEWGALDELLSNASIRKVDADYDMEAVVRELAAGNVLENPFYVVDLTTVMRKLADWKRELPRIKPLYATKSLSLGTHPDSLIYANPCEQANMLRYARKMGVHRMTADNVEELYKICDIFPEARVVLRITVDDSKLVCRFNSKFSSTPQEWDLMLLTIKELGMNQEGVRLEAISSLLPMPCRPRETPLTL